MAVYDLQEQEQIDEIKAWWKQYGSFVLLIAVACALTVGGYQGWQYYKNKQGTEAGELYSQLQAAAAANEAKKVQDIAAAIVEKYPRTGYAAYSSLAAAKAAFDGGDAATARARLQWVVDNARDDPTRDIARLRLGAVLLDLKQYDDAVKLVDAPHVEAFSALFADLKGDVLVAQGKLPEARAAYQQALDKSEAKSNYRTLIQIKLDALGSAK